MEDVYKRQPPEDGRIPGVARDGTVFLKMDDRQWRIAIHPTDGTRELLYMGLELEDHLALERCAQMLRDEGHKVRPARPEEARARAVTGLFFSQDPVSYTHLDVYKRQVGEVVAPEALLPRAHSIARSIAKNSPSAMARTKKAIWRSLDLPLHQALDRAWQDILRHNREADFAEGCAAFAERRAPVWQSWTGEDADD